jgi:glycosidase
MRVLSWLILLNVAIILIGCGSKSESPVPITPTVEIQPKQYDTPFVNVPQTSDVAMYEVNLSAFSSTGNLKGVESRLDSIKNLGINVIWLMPIYPIGILKGVGSPYAVRNYKEVNPTFGNLEDLRSLVKEAHKRNMALILDWVGNHTAWDNPWIQNTSWYAQDASGKIIIPPGTNFSDVAQLNYGNTEMRYEMIKSMKYWMLEANVDGFRCDYASPIPTNFWKQAIDTLRNIPNRKVIMFAESDKTALFSAGFDMTFGWSFYYKLKDVYNKNTPVSELASVNNTDYSDIPKGSHIVRWISNHDDNAYDDSPINIFKSSAGSMTAFVLTTYMGGVPLIYTGQEVGFAGKLGFFSNNSIKIDWNSNPQIRSEYKKIMTFRNGSEAVKRGSIETYNSSDIMAFKRVSGKEEVVVLANVRNSKIIYPLPSALVNSIWKNALSNEAVSLNNSIVVEPYGYLILKK